MSEIASQHFPLQGADSIFTTALQISTATKDTIIQTIRDSGDKANNPVGANACMTDLFMQNTPGFTELEKEINSVVEYLPNLIPNCMTTPFEVGITNMWGILYKKNDYIKVHNHWPSIWSGVFYLDIPKDYAGTLFFPELEHNIEPLTGQLVIFSGSTKHGVETIKSNGERLAVSFNYMAAAHLVDIKK